MHIYIYIYIDGWPTGHDMDCRANHWIFGEGYWIRSAPGARGMDFIASRPICSWFGFLVISRKRCSCRAVAYCDPLCQLRHWDQHKLVCAWWSLRCLVREICCKFELDSQVNAVLMAYLG